MNLYGWLRLRIRPAAYGGLAYRQGTNSEVIEEESCLYIVYYFNSSTIQIYQAVLANSQQAKLLRTCAKVCKYSDICAKNAENKELKTVRVSPLQCHNCHERTLPNQPCKEPSLTALN
jgi:hypothetical protein